MKYWCDDYDTYAAETLDDVKAEQIALDIVSESDWETENWRETDGCQKMWVTPFEDLDINRMNADPEYKMEMEKLHQKTLDEVFNSPELKPESETGRAWFMCSTEY